MLLFVFGRLLGCPVKVSSPEPLIESVKASSEYCTAAHQWKLLNQSSSAVPRLSAPPGPKRFAYFSYTGFKTPCHPVRDFTTAVLKLLLPENGATIANDPKHANLVGYVTELC
jgi:hypothetical protein